MPNRIILKRSSVAAKTPVSLDLSIGELAINLSDKRLYSKDGSGNIINVTVDASHVTTGTLADARIASAATWNAKEPGIAAGTTAQYWRGDKSWQTLNSTAVGLGSVENKSSATIRGEITYANVTTALGFTPYNSSNPNGYITSSGSISGNAATASTLQTARTINGTSFNGSANIDTTEWYHSDRDYPNGTLITTNINYAVTNGDPFVVEIRGNSYGNIVPLDLIYQGYIYSGTIINHGGLSNGLTISGMVALNVGGNLCFWFPNQGYWQGYNVRVYVPYASRPTNRVTSITGGVKPAGTKEVALSSNIRQSLHSSNYTSYSPSLTGSGASGSWGISITGSAASITGTYGGTLTSSQVTTALGYTPYNSTNPNGYTSNTGTVTSVAGTGTVSGLTLTGTVSTTGSLTLGGTLSLTSANVTTALGYTPYNSTNPNGYITSSGSISGNAATVTNGVYTIGDQSIAGQKTFTGKIRMQSNLGLNAGQVLYFGYEEGFGGSDTGGADYGYITYDNNNSTYGTAGGETSTLRLGTQNDGDGSVGDHVAIESAANIYLRPGAWGGGGSVRVGTLSSYSTVLHSSNYTSYSPSLTGSGASGTWGISITGSAASITGTYGGSLTSSQVTTALGFTPYNSTNPNGYTSNTGTVTSVSGTGTVSGLTLTGTVSTTGSLTLGGTLSLTSANVTSALGFTPYNATNPSGYITSSGSISGNAATATTTDNINGRAFYNRDSGNSLGQDSYTVNGVGYVTGVSLFGQTDGGLHASAYSTSWVHQIYGDFRTGQIAVRGKNSGTWQSWRVVLDASNYSSYALPLSGGTVSGSTTFNNYTYFNSLTTVNAYLNCSQWFNITGGAGYGLLGNGTNGAHFYLNSGSYGPWKILGSRNGWSGLEFGGLQNGEITLMVAPGSYTTGFYNTYYGWHFYWSSGTMWMSMSTYGGGNLYAVLNSGNWGNYISASMLGLGSYNYVTFYSVSDAIGNLRTIVQNYQTAAYTLTSTDSGKHIRITTGGVTVPSGVFSAGQAITVYNDSGSNQTITQGSSVTMYLGGTATTGNRTLAQRGVATLLCIDSSTFVISGAGLT